MLSTHSTFRKGENMKSPRSVLSVVLLLLSTLAFAQSEMEKADAQKSPATAVPSEAQKSFDKLKALAGDWEGAVTADPPTSEMPAGARVHVSMRITSRGNALVHEMQEPGTPLDPTKYDHPLTMIYLNDDQLHLVHYCDAGNRPHMVAKSSPDGRTVEFTFVDLSGGNEYGHMYHAVFTAVDANHHTEDWTYLMPGDKPMHGHMDLKRVN
jgi:hypothetical protein